MISWLNSFFEVGIRSVGYDDVGKVIYAIKVLQTFSIILVKPDTTQYWQ